MNSTAHTPTETEAQRTAPSRLRAVLLTTSLILVLIGDVLSFNQLATQSATDAILQTIVFSIGAAGFIEFLRRAITPVSRLERRTALVPAFLSVGSIVIWRAELPVGWSVIVTFAAAIALGTTVIQMSRRSGDEPIDDSMQLLGLLCFAQTLIFIYIAALTTADASANLFG